eukprot:3397727-Pleurochrysis_carterae.AAC.1
MRARVQCVSRSSPAPRASACARARVQYRRALLSADELERKARDEPNEIDALCDELEVGLSLLGSTAIEDKLQARAPQARAA